jgi:hypothetical protein
LITKSTTPQRLIEQVHAHDGQPFTIVGEGAHARRLLLRLKREVPDLRIARFGGPAEEIPPGEEHWAPYIPAGADDHYEYAAWVGTGDPPGVIFPG